MANQRTPFKISCPNYLKIVIGGFLVFLLGGATGYAAGYTRTMDWIRGVFVTIHPVREYNERYHFIAPLLLYDFGAARPFFENTDLEAKLNDYIQTQYAEGNASSVSVSFRDFALSRWAGVNQNALYQPGSMLKVLIMMAYFREAERNAAVLQAPLAYSQSIADQSNNLAFNLPSQLTVGQTYTVEQLIEAMIENSDNGAETLLINNVNRDTLNRAYTDLGIPSPDTVTGDYTLSTSQYADFLRILYNATYLNEQYSEQALSIMSSSTYQDGISAGVPAGTTVAQKYGSRVDASGNAIQAYELHDCGIVYTPSHPYALCIMTKGKDPNKLPDVLKNISSIVYQYVTAQAL